MPRTTLRNDRTCVVVIGSDDIGSAIACVLHRAGAAVVIADSADPPWARRGMSYADAWYVGGATLDGVDACFCGSVRSLPAILARGDMVAATTWSWEGVVAAVRPVAVVETRGVRATSAAPCRPVALEGALAIGVRTAQVGGWPADAVITGGTSAPSADADCSDVPAAKFDLARIDAPHAGRFRTRHEIAERVDIGDVVGELGSFVAVARVAGVLTALAARGSRIAPGHTLVEIDSRGDAARCFGVTPEARAIAHRVGAVVRNATKDSPSELQSRARERPPVPA